METQETLFAVTWEEKWLRWKLTPEGRKTLYRIIKVGMAMRKKGIKTASIRDLIAYEKIRRVISPNKYSDGFAVNNNFISHMSRYIETRHPELKGFFTKRKYPESMKEDLL